MLVSILCFLDIIYLQTNKKQIENVNFNIFLCFTIWIELLKNFTRFLPRHLQLQICLVFITNLMKFLLPRQNENFIKLRPLRNNGLKSFLINHTYYSECCFKKKITLIARHLNAIAVDTKGRCKHYFYFLTFLADF